MQAQTLANIENMDEDLKKLATAFKANVQVRNRSYHLKEYKKCFVGSEAVDYFISSGKAKSREDAVDIGRSLMSDLHLFEHVTRDHDFKDDHKFYRFLEENERGGFRVDKKNGGCNIRWNHFLDSFAGASSSGGGREDHDSLLPNFNRSSRSRMNELSITDEKAVSMVWPLDQYNRELLDQVHPPDWQDPITKKSDGTYLYDLVVIGAGAGGLVTAAGAAGVGAKVALIEANLLGGDCLNVGCVPSKTIIHSANLAHTLKGNPSHLEEAGLFLDPSAVRIDFEKVMERVRKIRSSISHHDSAERFTKELGVNLFLGYGKFTSERTIEVNGKTLHFKRAVIATGGYPALPTIPGLKDLHEKAIDPSFTCCPDEQAGSEEQNSTGNPRPIVMTNETFFNLTKKPKNMIVIGPGVIGMELGQAMQRLDVNVTMLGRYGRVLPKEDEDLALLVQQQMEKDGVTFRLTVTEFQMIELTGSILEENGYPEMKLTITEKTEGGREETRELICDALLVAAGRRPNVKGMNLELAKVEYDTKKGILVNDNFVTSNARVFGVGDCCSEYKFTHAADFMARAVIRNALFLGNAKQSNLLIPYATFTTPEIASVGLYEKDLQRKGKKYRIIEKHFKDVDRSICDNNTAGLVRFRVDAKTDKILGATIVGENAGNMISEITLAIQSNTGLSTLASVIHPYPTTAEAIRQAGDLYNKTRLTTTVKSLLRGVINLQR